jgi:hypothetical protein
MRRSQAPSTFRARSVYDEEEDDEDDKENAGSQQQQQATQSQPAFKRPCLVAVQAPFKVRRAAPAAAAAGDGP